MKRQQLIFFVMIIMMLASLACSNALASTQNEAGEAGEPAEAEAIEPATQVEAQAGLAEESSKPVPTPTATPLPKALGVTGMFDYININDQFEIVGTIYNGTDGVVTDVELTITATDAAGNTLLKDFFGNMVDSAAFAPMISTLRPGQSAPFEYTIYGEVKPDTYEIKVTHHTAAEAGQPVNVVVENGRMVESDSGILYVVGELVNLGQPPVQISKLVSAVMDGNGQIISVGDSLEDGFYLAGAGDANGYDRVPFRNAVNYGGLKVTAETWTTFIDAAVVEPKTAYDVMITESTIYQDKNGKSHLIGTVANHSPETLEVHLIGSVYGADGGVLDVDTLTLPFYALGPGEALPFEFAWLDIINQTSGENAKIDRIKVQVDLVATTLSSAGVTPLQTGNDTHEVSEGWWDMAGEVMNNSDQSFYRTTVIIGLYDAQNKLVGTNFGYAYAEGDADIQPQAVTGYSISLYTAPEVDPAAVTVKTYVQGNLR